MKKMIAIVLMLTLAISIVGCGVQSAGKPAQTGNPASQESQSPTAKQSSYFGKISEMVGNELSLTLAREPEGGIEEYLKNSQEGDGNSQMAGGEGVEIPMDSEDSKDGAAGNIGGDGPQNLGEDGNVAVGEVKPEDIVTLDLEYTGEKVTLSIPAGIKIHDLRTGEDSKLSVIKKGSIIKAYGEEVNGKIVVSRIDIVE